ncbi:hypothetical protein, partial [Escherichia coli]|uniref:hypothetical protein n=1 Tax=Escherichia coli TaxID=562 RepID=UPI001E29D9A7
DRNRSHWSTSKTPSYTKSVSWQHHRDGKINICEYINKEQLEKLNPPEDLRIAIKKLGWNN